jgi:hypothetical protein
VVSRSGLIIPTLVLIVAEAFHDLDHVRQGRAIEAPVILLGVVAYLAAFTVLVLAAFRHPFRFVAATVVGFGTAIGFVLVHVLPDWGPYADGYPDASVDVASWVVLGLDIAVALWVGLGGLRGRPGDTAHQAE